MNQAGRRWRGYAIALACVLTLGCGSVALAGDARPSERADALEQAFWACDYIGTTQGVAEAPVALCVEVTELLRDERFGGDFDALVAWWRQNKAKEHARLAAEAVPVANRAPGTGV